MKGKWILVVCLILACIGGGVMGLKREKSLAIEAAKVHLENMAASASSGIVRNEGAYTIKDVDNYGRNWTIWAVDTKGNAIAVNVHSSRGIGPIPLFNVSASLAITAVEVPEKVE